MKREYVSYSEAIAWIAQCDQYGLDTDHYSYKRSVRMVADLFNTDEYQVIADVMKRMKNFKVNLR